MGQEAGRALGVIPSDVDLAHGRSGQLAEGLGRHIELVYVAGLGTLVHHHERNRIAVSGIFCRDTGTAAASIVVVGPIERHVIVGVIGSHFEGAVARAGRRVQAGVPSSDSCELSRRIGGTIFGGAHRIHLGLKPRDSNCAEKYHRQQPNENRFNLFPNETIPRGAGTVFGREDEGMNRDQTLFLFSFNIHFSDSFEFHQEIRF